MHVCEHEDDCYEANKQGRRSYTPSHSYEDIVSDLTLSLFLNNEYGWD